jgi:sugar phosphate permease
MIAVEQEEMERSGVAAATFVATVASVSELGGAVGQFINGVICAQLGGRRSSFLYLLGSAVCCMFLSSTSSASRVGGILAGFEFFESVQWTACSTVFSRHYYEEDPASLAAAITLLSLTNTAGTLLAKTCGAALLQKYSWRFMAQVAAAVALLGSLLMWALVSERPPAPSSEASAALKAPRERFCVKSAIDGIMAVISSPLFWCIGLANSTAFLAFTSDKVLGSFFQQVTDLPSKFYREWFI